jgi:hypothetical protein
MFIPLIIYQNLILPQFILPSAQALGMWGRITQFFGLTWAIWDVGTSVASMKFLSQYRVNDPRRGFKYMQVYVWWQALSGAVQVALVVAFASTGLVRTPYALFAWSVVIHSLIQIPGFYGVFRGTLNALQRNDYARYIDAAWAIVIPILTQLALVPIFYAWGKANPAMGASMGGVLGMGAAALWNFRNARRDDCRCGWRARNLGDAKSPRQLLRNLGQLDPGGQLPVGFYCFHESV